MSATRFAILAAVLVGALALGALAYQLAPPAIAWTAAVAVYAASLATAGFLVNGRQAVIDRSDLQAEVTLVPGGGTNRNIQVRFFNAGRRPVRVEDSGMWRDKSRMSPYPYWRSWRKDEGILPKTLPEGDSHVIYTWPAGVAIYYARDEPVAFLWAKPATGATRWWALPDDVRRAVAEEWPAAREKYRKEKEAEAAKPGELDDYGHPVRPAGEHDEG